MLRCFLLHQGVCPPLIYWVSLKCDDDCGVWRGECWPIRWRVGTWRWNINMEKTYPREWMVGRGRAMTLDYLCDHGNIIHILLCLQEEVHYMLNRRCKMLREMMRIKQFSFRPMAIRHCCEEGTRASRLTSILKFYEMWTYFPEIMCNDHRMQYFLWASWEHGAPSGVSRYR